jgi:hypothetical protein
MAGRQGWAAAGLAVLARGFRSPRVLVEARYWAGRIAVAVGWPQEVHRFPHRGRFETDAQP